MRRWVRQNWPVLVLALGITLGVLAFVKFGVRVGDAQTAAEQNRTNQINACDTSLEPGGFRAQIAGDYRAEIKTHKGNIRRTRRIDYAKFGLTVSKKVQRNAIARESRAITHLRDKIHNVLSVDCAAQYPKP